MGGGVGIVPVSQDGWTFSVQNGQMTYGRERRENDRTVKKLREMWDLWGKSGKR